ncbi:MAG TPA: hemerythrin domain-containing protein [Candidatus Limnocylindria bacterium]|nr:hemerythrin domain-containing protein [Candidatus Limnocylindria bacterium]
MDVLTLLKEDHDKVKRVLEEGDATTERGEKTRTELFTRLKTMLTAHEAMEEEVLYPALKAHPKARELTLEAFEEHHVVDMVLEELEATPVSDEQWGAKWTVAKENIEHHIEEEEGEMFRDIRELFSTDEREQMAARMAEIQALALQVQKGEI